MSSQLSMGMNNDIPMTAMLLLKKATILVITLISLTIILTQQQQQQQKHFKNRGYHTMEIMH